MTNDPLTPTEIEAGLVLCGNATEGPWMWQADEGFVDRDGIPFVFIFGPDGQGMGRIAEVFSECGGFLHDDAAFIADSRFLFPRALAQLQAQAAEIARLTVELASAEAEAVSCGSELRHLKQERLK